ncbi:MAG: hypothetical protein ACI4NE_07450 [Succinivibrio sp.]
MQKLTLSQLIEKITEAENALAAELSKDDIDLTLDYVAIAQRHLKEIADNMPSYSDEEKEEAIEFAKAYGDHIREQKTVIERLRQETASEYKKVKNSHAVSSKYKQAKYNI